MQNEVPWEGTASALVDLADEAGRSPEVPLAACMPGAAMTGVSCGWAECESRREWLADKRK